MAFGVELKKWRTHRRFSQLALSSEAGVSQRHLSFLETGKAKPSREMVLHLARILDLSLRSQNEMLAQAGFSAAYEERSINNADVTHVYDVLERMVEAHSPFPAYVVNRRWDLVLSNEAALVLLGRLISAEVLGRLGSNILILTFHPDGLRGHIDNWTEVAGAALVRLRREMHELPGSADLIALHDEIMGFPGMSELVVEPRPAKAGELLLPVRFRSLGLSLFTTITTIGSAFDVTLEELRLETLLPADAESETKLRQLVS